MGCSLFHAEDAIVPDESAEAAPLSRFGRKRRLVSESRLYSFRAPPVFRTPRFEEKSPAA